MAKFADDVQNIIQQILDMQSNKTENNPNLLWNAILQSAKQSK